jgi:hypothetical protein
MMRWVIQSNLGNKEDSERIRDICIRQGYGHEFITVIPFTKEIPSISNDQPTVFYGATNFINNIYESGRWNPGTFFNAENFTVRAYVEHYKEHMINHPCEFSTIGKFASSHQPMDKQFFVRPIKDLKEFAGDVMEFNDMVRWERNIRYLPGCDNNPTLTVDTEIVVSEPHGIAHEWRVFIVNGKVSSGSHYRSYMKLDSNNDFPQRVIEFVERMCEIWVPAPVFVMDVGESAGNLFIIECNCFNSSGFYKSNIEKIVVDVSEFITGA